MPSLMFASSAEKRRRNRSLSSCLCTPPPYPGYSAMLRNSNKDSSASGETRKQSLHDEISSFDDSAVLLSSSPSSTDSKIGETGDEEKRLRRQCIKENTSLVSSGYGSAGSESDQDQGGEKTQTAPCKGESRGRHSRVGARILRHQTEISSRRRSVPAYLRDAFPEDIVRVLQNDGIVGPFETDADTGISYPLLMDCRSINRPETVLELARKFAEVAAAQEVERHRSRSRVGKENTTKSNKLEQVTVRSGPSTPAHHSAIPFERRLLGGIASLSLNQNMSKTTNIFKQMDAANSGGKAFTAVARNPSSIKEALLRWCQLRVQDYPVTISNFSSSWADGMAFCALVHRFAPTSFDFRSLDPRNRRFNLELAFRVAEEQGVAALLEVDDMLLMGDRPDWKCVFTYVQTLYKHFRDRP